MNIDQYSLQFLASLQSIYSPDESMAIKNLVFFYVLGYEKITLYENRKTEISANQALKLAQILNRLLESEPVHYILGEKYFYGMRFEVNPDVLIPRPETEFLADMVIKENRGRKLRIIDICTGSGCLAVSLKKNIPQAVVWATDVSEPALKVAERNAKNQNCEIHFIHHNILSDELPVSEVPFDIIVSNPPYITHQEKVGIEKNVIAFEPHLALFVSDSNPLQFYKTIIEKSITWLGKEGKLYFEINENFGNELLSIVEQYQFKKVMLKKDLSGKDRYLVLYR